MPVPFPPLPPGPPGPPLPIPLKLLLPPLPPLPPRPPNPPTIPPRVATWPGDCGGDGGAGPDSSRGGGGVPGAVGVTRAPPSPDCEPTYTTPATRVPSETWIARTTTGAGRDPRDPEVTV